MNIADRFALRVLRDGPATTDHLAAEVGVRLDTMQVVMSRLHKEKQVHVCEWFRTSTGHLKGIWQAGQGEDAPKPKHAEKEGRQGKRVTQERRTTADSPRALIQIEEIGAGGFNPFATAMWNVAQGAR